ncbi:MAG: phosphoglycerate mutase family protein [Actinobacteria bacterium]|nr:phosphoglycerate mutase family protein [Actinomycetota bacterium]
MVTFYLIRHGQKESIPFDPPLTKVGLKQAEFTAEFLKDIDFQEAISSPKLRTKQTAEIIAKPHSLNVTSDSRLVERVEWENDESFDEFLTEWNKTDIDRNYQPKKGTSSSKNGEQIKQLLDEFSTKHLNGNILIVTHGGTIGDLLRRLFTEQAIYHKTEPLSGAKYIDILECSVTTIQKSDKKYELLKLGDISHLPIPLI